MIRGAYMEWMGLVMNDAYEYPPLYHAIMAFSLGFLALLTKHKQHSLDSGKHRYIAIHELQEELSKEQVDNVDPLLACSLILSWDVFFQDDNIESYATLSKGLAAVLEKVHIMATPTPAAACMTDALFQGIKAIQMPPYDPTFFQELVDKIKSIGRYYHDDGQNENDYNRNNNKCPKLAAQHDSLMAYVSDVLAFVKQNPRRNFNSSKSGARYHSPKDMFHFVRRWMQIFPSEALARRDPCLLYVYYHAVTRALDALFPEVRYMFQFGFIGPVDLAGIENVISNKNDVEFQYPVKVLVFFKERLFLLNRLLIAQDPLKITIDMDKILETPVKSFLDTLLTAENYPSINNEMSPPPSLASSASTISNSASVNSPGEDHQLQQQDNSATGGAADSSTMDIFKNYFHDRMEILYNCNL